jgi:GTP-binding protein
MIKAFNKWDLLKGNPDLLNSLEVSIERHLDFVAFVPVIRISALTGERIGKLFQAVDAVWTQYNTRVPTPLLNRALEDVVRKTPPPSVGGKSLKLFYATQISVQPPTFVIFANRPDSIRTSYKRYLINQFRANLKLDLIPIKMHFRGR